MRFLPVSLAVLVVGVVGLGAAARADAHPDRPVLLSGDPSRELVVLFQPVGSPTRPLYASFGTPARFSPPVEVTAPPARGMALAGNTGGDAVATWLRAGIDSDGPVRAAGRAGGADSFGTPQSITGKKVYGGPDVRMNARGDAVVRFDVTADVGLTYSSWRPAGGAFARARLLPAGSAAGVGLDDNGRAIALVPGGGGLAQPFWAMSERGLAWQLTGSAGDRGRYEGRLLGVNGSGLAVAQWRDETGAVALVARIPGGPDWHLESAPSLRAGDDVLSFTLGQGGHAVLVYGARLPDGQVDVYVSVRSPDGGWGQPQRIGSQAPVEQVASAVDPQGAVAVAFRRDDGVVRAAYAEPGGGLAWTTLYDPPLAELSRGYPPALAIGGGRAVAAWQQSDGDRVATVVRTFGPAGAGAKSTIARQRAWVREAPASRCLREGRTLQQTREARVYLVRDDHGSWYTDTVFGCQFKRGNPVVIGRSGDPDPTVAALAGPLVAMRVIVGEEDGVEDIDVYDEVWITDLRDPIHGLNAEYGVGGDDVADVVVNRRGGAAWIKCHPGCDVARPMLAVVRKHSDRTRPTDVAHGRDIARRSLKLQGKRLSWMQAGRRHTASLR